MPGRRPPTRSFYQSGVDSKRVNMLTFDFLFFLKIALRQFGV